MGAAAPAIRRAGRRAGRFAILAPFVVFTAFPFYWMLITAFKQNRDLFDRANNPYVFNALPTLEHLNTLFTETAYLLWLWNTAFVGVLVVVITLLLALPAGYSLARLPGRLAQSLAIGIFLTYIIQPTILFIPFSKVIATLGLQDTLWSLVVVYPTLTVPFCTWLLMGFFKAIPRDLEEAAMIDGLSRFGAFLKVVLPLSLSGILTAVIFAFSLVMQEFVYALTFITSNAQLTVGVGIPTFLVRGDVYFWGSIMAGCLIASIPVAIVYNLFLDRFIAGFTAGAVR